MKRMFALLTLAVACLAPTWAGDVITHDVKRLPRAARTFIATYFVGVSISHIKIESELFQTRKYEVLLTDRTEIDFDKQGEWLKVDCDEGSVPAGLVPPPVSAYLNKHFPNVIIREIERKRRTVEVELSNDLALTFDLNGVLLETDD